MSIVSDTALIPAYAVRELSQYFYDTYILILRHDMRSQLSVIFAYDELSRRSQSRVT